MRVSYKWLSEYINLDNVSPNELAEKLTNAGIEVEGVEPFAIGSNLVVAKINSVEAHPDSDHLNIVSLNNGEEDVVVVCGASNVKNAKKVILAKPGAVLKDITIKKGVIRGVESNGMICSLAELGIDKKFLKDEQINGIEILDEDAPVGCDALKYLGLDDYILDVSLTPNRADCISLWSLSKEVGAVLRRKANLPNVKDVSNTGSKTELKISSNTKNCPIFLAKTINNINIKESPKWMKDYLHSAGIKSINNVVDISNYVMIETGQPLHFYDKSKLSKQELIVVDDRECDIKGLDGIDYKIEKGDLLITCDNNIVGIAGIMGSESSKIDENTTSIIIESALFNNVSIRNTANRIGLITEAASRFIKGLDPLSQVKAMDRAIDLLIKYADASLIEETVYYGDIEFKENIVTESLSHCNYRLGTNYSKDEVLSVLEALDFSVKVEGENFICSIPSYRTDIKIPEDLDEEIIRLIGYDTLPTTLPTMQSTVGLLDHKQKLERLTKDVMNSFGLNEIVTYSLVKEDYILNSLMPFGDSVKLLSPLSDDRKYVRNSLISSVLECVSYNQNRKFNDLSLFEISNVYADGLVESRLAIALSGNIQKSRLHKINIKNDFYMLKGIIESYLEKCGISLARVKIEVNDIDVVKFHPYRSAKVYIQNDLFGIFGDLNPTYANKMDVSDVVYGEFRLDVLFNLKTSKIKYTPLDKYPSVSRDIAIIVERSLPVSNILKTITKAAGNLVKNLEIFDIYTGEHVKEDEKSVALNIIYQSKEKTLTDEEINKAHSSILEKLEKELKAKLRG